MPDDEVVTLGRAGGSRGEVVLRRRTTGGGSVDELIVNGAFAMDSSEVSTERALARMVARPDATVLVGGLGLGFTVAELLRHPVARVEVVELEECLIGWAADGLTDTLGAVAADPRVTMHLADVADALLGRDVDVPEAGWDAILLDVDNGPDFLIHEANARIYRADLLRVAADGLAPGGTLAVWCQGPAPGLAATLRSLGGDVDERLVEVVRDGRALAYAIYSLTRPTG